jgi:hypothetical protein
MAIAFDATYEGEGASLENYHKILEQLNATPEGPHPGAGCLFHWITETPGGFRVTDVWMTRAQLDAFLDRLGPIASELGVPEPQMTEFEVANYLTAAT